MSAPNDPSFTPGTASRPTLATAALPRRVRRVLDQAYNVDGIAGWNQHRVHIYDPGNGNMKRSYHIDGRAGEAKYDDSQVF